MSFLPSRNPIPQKSAAVTTVLSAVEAAIVADLNSKLTSTQDVTLLPAGDITQIVSNCTASGWVAVVNKVNQASPAGPVQRLVLVVS